MPLLMHACFDMESGSAAGVAATLPTTSTIRQRGSLGLSRAQDAVHEGLQMLTRAMGPRTHGPLRAGR
eukprot:3809772-Alexandrium_andersonii.AAC.1